MDTENIVNLTLFWGEVFIATTLLKAYYKKNMEIPKNFERVYRALGQQLRRTSVYDPKETRTYHELLATNQILVNCLDNNTYPSLREWDQARSLMKKHNLW